MRVITGTARGRRLIAPQGQSVRPTVDRVKEGIFSALQFDIEGRRILDLFAGSGQLGIEALSRGAKFCTFVDSSADSLKCVRENVSSCGFNDVSEIKAVDSLAFLQMTQNTFDIAFLDPPYNKELIVKALPKLCELMSDYGIIICEHPLEDKLPEKCGDFSVSKEYRYGKVYVTVYKKQR